MKKTWQKIALAAGGVLLLEIGARIVMPGLNADALANYLRSGGGSWLMNLYSQLGGGGLVRGGVLALGIMPYLAAKIYARLAGVVVPSIKRMVRTDEGRKSLARWTRILTGGLALVQSYGFARFVQNIPGAVAHPGAGFMTQTVLLLTGSSIAAMLIVEGLTRTADDDDDRPSGAAVASPPLELGEGPVDAFSVRTEDRAPVKEQPSR